MAQTPKDTDVSPSGPPGFRSSCRIILGSSWANILLLSIPLPYLVTPFSPLWSCIACFLSAIPLLKIFDLSMANISSEWSLTSVGLSSGSIFEQLIAFHAIYYRQPDVALPLALGSFHCGILLMTGVYILVFGKYLALSSYKSPVVYHNLGVCALSLVLSMWTYWQGDYFQSSAAPSLVLATFVLLGSLYIYAVQLHQQTSGPSPSHSIHPKRLVVDPSTNIIVEFKPEGKTVNSWSATLSLVLSFGMMIPIASHLLGSTMALMHDHIPFHFTSTVFIPLVIRLAVLLPSIHSVVLTEAALLNEIRRGMDSMTVHFPISVLAAATFGNPVSVHMHPVSSCFFLFSIFAFWILHAQREERMTGLPLLVFYVTFALAAATGVPV
ncbi:hypothetical protein MIND_00683500 [Mycena indigotica]|uniref:Uncharacterized protein n=1 Tax=Mycena indigotica TaxID=2126181 RepID=A0A8H6SK50_9AGAR|nr:uncharacterized protein MIND_00683500 [Mycena indigotica]KAF7301190.1 hypothetical protein MIND_00683500 [Mycena indigotica]